ncbi:MAG: MerR family transcriptional regulator [Acidobacteriota bacterium]
MADTSTDIPDRELFKAAEVCEIAGVQPYVLRSWESEFPTLGFAKAPGSPRQYRRADVERVLRIKQLVYGEGLTLAGARRRLDGDVAATEETSAHTLPDARRKLDLIKSELRALVEMLGEPTVHARKPRRVADAGQPTLLDLNTDQPVEHRQAGDAVTQAPERRASRKRARPVASSDPI